MPVEALYDLPLLLLLHADPASVEGETDNGEHGEGSGNDSHDQKQLWLTH